MGKAECIGKKVLVSGATPFDPQNRIKPLKFAACEATNEQYRVFEAGRAGSRFELVVTSKSGQTSTLKMPTVDSMDRRAAEEAAKAAVEAERQAALVPVAESNKAKGTIVRREVAWKCIDVHALYQARPELVRVEPNAAAIRSVCFPEMPVPGLKLWWETKVTARKA